MLGYRSIDIGGDPHASRGGIRLLLAYAIAVEQRFR